MPIDNRKGERAPDFALKDRAGREIRLMDFEGHWLLMVFHRHLAWLPCREHLSQLRQEKKKLDQLNIKVIVITFEPERLIALPPPEENFPYYVDKERQLYRYYGFLKAGFWDLWGPPTWLSYLRLLLKGRKIMKSESDIYQRGGDVLIDQRGMIRFHHIGAGPADRPDLDVIFNLVENRL